MNRDTIVGFILIAVILVGYSIWMTPSQEEMEQRRQRADSISAVRQQQQMLDSVRMAAEIKRIQQEIEQDTDLMESGSEQPAAGSAPDYQELRNRFGLFAGASKGQERIIYLENDVIRIAVNTKGGYIREVELKNYKTFDSMPLKIYDKNTALFDLSFFAMNRNINTANFFFEPYYRGQTYEGDELKTRNDSLVFGMRLYADNELGERDPGRYIEYEYRLQTDQYMMGFDINLVGMDNVMASNTSFISLDWKADMLRQEKSVDRFNGSTIYYKHLSDDVDYLSEGDSDEESIRTRLKWVSYKQRFFSASLIAGQHFDNAELRTSTNPSPANPRYLKTMHASLELPFSFSKDQTIPMSFYFGPLGFGEMRAYGIDLERQIPLGWGFFLLAWINMYIVIPVFNFLGSYGWNYGIVILVLTVLLKIMLFPIAYKTYLSSAKMRVLKPEVDELSKKFPKKEDAMKKQQAVMQLYKRAGASPMAGCIPMLLQMPILIALFRFFPSSIELRQQSFLWAEDLSSYDSILNLPFEIPFYGDHVSLFTLLMSISTVIYTHLNMNMTAGQGTQMPGMKTMMYLMPIMFLGLFNNYASGLSYYYFLANVITFVQMYIFRLAINEDKLRAKIEANKKRPVKKSGFQKRLEDAAKKRGYQMPK
jgi:YidC/Oxa1 family membrane protein insertase